MLHAQTAEKIARGISELALRHNESDLTGRKRQEGCAIHLKIGTAPQRERSDRPKVTRGLRERSQNSRSATTRAIRHAKSDKRVARFPHLDVYIYIYWI